MPENKSYVQLDLWKKSRELVKEVYQLTMTFPKEELYALTSQMRRSVISIPSNIAEGVARNFQKETIQFLHIAKGSLYELETQVYLAFDLNYITNIQLNTSLAHVEECKKLIFGFINYYKNKPNQ